jgi:2-methylcitrate dehydratase PrpD
MGETALLAKYIAGARYEDLPQEVVNHAKKSISDTIACAFGAHGFADGEMLISMMKDIGGKEEATIIGEKSKLSFMQAVQVNSVLASMLDYDDTLIKVGHLSAVFVPLALAVGEYCRASCKDIINALVLGCETTIRIREAVEPSEEAFWKTLETIGTGMNFGVTVVAGKLLGLSEEQMADAFGLTGRMRASRITMPDVAQKGMPRWMKITGGDITIPGIHAVFLARRGFPGDRGILDQGRGYEGSVGSDRYEASKLYRDFGMSYKMLRISYKLYPSCRHFSSTLDAVAQIMSENRLVADEIEEVLVSAQEQIANRFAQYEPEHMIQAAFSVPYGVSMVLLGEPPGPHWYTSDMLKNSKARRIQHKVKLQADPIFTSKFYTENKYASAVEIRTTNGKRFYKQLDFSKGDPENPFTEENHKNKLTAMASWAGLEQNKIGKLIGALDRFEELATVSELSPFLVP